MLHSQHQFMVGRETDLSLVIGTPGLGPGTTARVGYEGVVPENLYPAVEIVYSPQRAGEKPVRERYELKGRC